MADVETEVKGLSDLLAALDALPLRLERNVVRTGLRKGAAKITIYERALLSEHSKSGRLARSVAVKAKRKDGMPAVAITLGNKQAYYAHMVERGTKAHDIRPRKAKALRLHGNKFAAFVRHPGFPGLFIVKRAVESRALDAVEAFRQYAKSRIGDEWNKLAKKGLVS